MKKSNLINSILAILFISPLTAVSNNQYTISPEIKNKKLDFTHTSPVPQTQHFLNQNRNSTTSSTAKGIDPANPLPPPEPYPRPFNPKTDPIPIEPKPPKPPKPIEPPEGCKPTDCGPHSMKHDDQISKPGIGRGNNGYSQSE
ncbi:TPA: hypothetical protein QHN47_004451 [Klebsiella aerogenes]|nr:hypothetical protein [Klebsiella aerogenes]HDT5519418.1 hypothetical protein [Klebsiella aerogenes]